MTKSNMTPEYHREAQKALHEALSALVDSIDRRLAWLNPGKQRDGYLSPIMEDALAKARKALEENEP